MHDSHMMVNVGCQICGREESDCQSSVFKPKYKIGKKVSFSISLPNGEFVTAHGEIIEVNTEEISHDAKYTVLITGKFGDAFAEAGQPFVGLLEKDIK